MAQNFFRALSDMLDNPMLNRWDSASPILSGESKQGGNDISYMDCTNITTNQGP